VKTSNSVEAAALADPFPIAVDGGYLSVLWSDAG
jgi:hypothetical protein